MRSQSSIRSRFIPWAALVICVAAVPASTAMAQAPDFAAVAVTKNQFAVGTALDNIAPGSSGSTLAMIDALAASSPGLQQQSMNQLSAEMFGSTQTIGLQVGDQFQQRIASRLISNGQFLAGALYPESVDDSEDEPPLKQNNYTSWTQAYGVGGSLYGDGNGSGVHYSQGAGIFGLDWGADDTGVIGISGGNSYLAFHDGIGGQGQLTSYQVGLYALKHNDIAYVLGTTSYGYNSFRTSRNVSIVGINQVFNDNFASNQLGAYAESGLKLHAGWVHFQPLIGLQYLYLTQQGFGESGGPAALNVSARQADSLRTSLGGRLIVDRMTGPRGAVWTPYWHVRWVAELLDNDRSINASFNSVPAGGTFTAYGTRVGQNYFVFGKGLQVQLTDRWSLYGNIDLMLAEHFRSEVAALGTQFIW